MASILDAVSSVASMIAGITVLLSLFLAALFVYVMARNDGRLRLEKLRVEFDPAERPIDRISVDWRLLTTDTLLTTRRVIQARASWFLSKRKLKVIELPDVHSIVWRRYTNWFLLLAGLYVVGTFNPLALFLILLGLERKVYSVRFATPVAQMPLTRLVVTTPWRRQLAEMRRFYSQAVAAWSGARLSESRPDTGQPGQLVRAVTMGDDEVDRDFAWGRPVLAYTVVFIVLAAIQRVVRPHIAYDDVFFGALYLGIPVAAAQRSARDGFWTALVAFVALLTVKFPTAGLMAIFTNDGGVPALKEYALVVAGLEAVVGVAALVSRFVHPRLSFLAIGVWLGVVWLLGSDLAQNFALYSLMLVAMAVAMVLVPVDRWLAVQSG